MTIQPIVEGYGDVEAVPELLRRLCAKAETYQIQIGKPIRANRSQLVRQSTLEERVRLALLQPDCSAILIMLDADDDCPRELAPKIQSWANSAAGVPCAVVIPNREYEAWFLAAIESLRGRSGICVDAEPPTNPESPRDAKGRLEDRMSPNVSYSETADQVGLTALFDMSLAYKRCRSFRKMAKAFGQLATAVGQKPATWPPNDWI